MKRLRRRGSQGAISRFPMRAKELCGKWVQVKGWGNLKRLKAEGRARGREKEKGEKVQCTYTVLYDNHRCAVPQADDDREA